MNLGDQVRAVGRLFSTESEAQSFKFGEFIVTVGVVLGACGSRREDSIEIELLFGANGGLSTRQLAGIRVEGDWTLGVIILEALGFRKAEGHFSGRVVGEVLLDILMRNQ